MTARTLDSRDLARAHRQRAAAEAARLAAAGTIPSLVYLQAREDPSGKAYVRSLDRACAKTGIRFGVRTLPPGAGQADLVATLDDLDGDRTVHAVMLQLPMPDGFDPNVALERLDPDKDAEGIHPMNLGRATGGRLEYAPCTPLAAMELIDASGIRLEGAEAVVVGHSEIVGRPLAMLLMQRMVTTTVCHSATRDLVAHTRRAEILAVAVGRPGLIRADMVRPGAVVIDIGINEVTGPDGAPAIAGDVDPAVAEVAGALTPVPGGVGPLTTARVLRNVVGAAGRRAAAESNPGRFASS